MKPLSKALRAAPRKPAIDWSSIERVLLVRLRSIGDTVLMTPCLQAIKAFRPQIRISVLIEEASAPVLREHPWVDELIVIPRLRNSLADLPGRLSLIQSLRSHRFDVALNLHGGTTATLLCWLSGAQECGAYAESNWSRLLTFAAPSPCEIFRKFEIHSLEQQLGLLAWAGLPLPERPATSLAVSANAQARADARLQRLGIHGRFAVVIPTATLGCKRWAAERFTEVIRTLSSEHRLPAVVITTTDPGWATRSGALVGNTGAIVHDVQLDELIALLDRADLLVCNDGGPAHIRAALSKPLVVIFGSMDPRVWRPWTTVPHRLVRAPIEERPWTEDPRKNTEKMEFIQSVTVDEVLAAIRELLSESEAGQHEAMKQS